jgi:hypothetical protein
LHAKSSFTIKIGKKHEKFLAAEVNSNFTERRFKKRNKREAGQQCSLLILRYMRRLYTFLKLETTVSVQMQPMVAYFEEGCERNLQN